MEPQKKEARTEFKRTFASRVAKARQSANFTQAQMATILAVEQDHYKHFEGRSLLPHHLIAKFCTATKTDPAWLFGLTGKRLSPVLPRTHKKVA